MSLTQSERLAHALATLTTLSARDALMGLVELYPNASIFWACGEDADEVVLFLEGVEIRIRGEKA